MKHVGERTLHPHKVVKRGIDCDLVYLDGGPEGGVLKESLATFVFHSRRAARRAIKRTAEYYNINPEHFGIEAL